MKEMDRVYTEHTYYGKRRLSITLKAKGHNIGVYLASALMKRMGIEAIYPQPNLRKPHPRHTKYPYLLRYVKIARINQVWSTDITYIPIRNGFLYLTALLDWYSRYTLAWKLSNSLDGSFCKEVLIEALKQGTPEIFNTDLRIQSTSSEFTQVLEASGMSASIDGRGCALDNIWIGRLWHSTKQEEVYIRDYSEGVDASRSLDKYFKFYNEVRPHSSIGYSPP